MNNGQLIIDSEAKSCMRYRYRSEEEMKDSGVEWLGKIPKTWDVKKLKYLAKIDTGDKDTQDKEENGIYPFFVRSDNVERSNTYSFEGEAILTAGDGVGVAKVFHYINGKFAYHQRVYKISNFKEVSGKFLYYYIKDNLGKEVEKISAKTTVDSLRLPMFLKFPVLITRDSEKKIVRFLDKKTAQFDSIILKKEVLIQKLEEAKKSLISEVVTGKVKVVKASDGYELVERKKEEMKDSGVEWLRWIPYNWNTTKLKNICSNITDGAHISPETESGVYPFISVKDLIGDELDFNNCLLTSKESFNYLKRNSCNPKIGDVLISKDGTIGKTTTIMYERDFVIASSLVILTPFKIYDSNYIEYVLNCNFVQKQIRRFVKGTALPRISITHLKEVILPYTVDIYEQKIIVDCLTNKIGYINNSINKINIQIQALKQAKQTLISEAVTGKIEILD